MNPFERWDDWEWEKAAQELGRERNEQGYEWRSSYNRPQRGSKSDSLRHWTGAQKKALLSAALFLMVFFASRGEDLISKGIYTFYQTGMESGNYYESMTAMAKDSFGLGETTLKSLPVDAKMQGKFLPSVSGPVEASFGLVDKANGTTHYGIDIGSSLGTTVVSPYRAIITAVGEDAQLGKIVKLDLGDGWQVVLGNLGDISVKKGQSVEAGSVIGNVGLSSPVKKPWLHFELRKDGRAVNPIPYFIKSAS